MVGGQCTVKRTSIPMAGLSNVRASLYGNRYQHPWGGTVKHISIPVWGWVSASLPRDGYRHPCRGTVKCTSIPVWEEVPASLWGDCQTYQHPCMKTGTSISRQIPPNYTQDQPRHLKPCNSSHPQPKSHETRRKIKAGRNPIPGEHAPRAPGCSWLPGRRSHGACFTPCSACSPGEMFLASVQSEEEPLHTAAISHHAPCFPQSLSSTSQGIHLVLGKVFPAIESAGKA